jgi:hypothetical protein
MFGPGLPAVNRDAYWSAIRIATSDPHRTSLRLSEPVSSRLFTPAEANSALSDVRPVAERLVALRARLRELEGTQRALVHAIGGNGGGHAAGDLNEARDEFTDLAGELADCVRRLEELGVLLKDPDTGLLDFPSLREGQEVLLCWRVGEETVASWHGFAEGFAGRKPIDWGE